MELLATYEVEELSQQEMVTAEGGFVITLTVGAWIALGFLGAGLATGFYLGYTSK